MTRKSGVLMPVSSLYGEYSCGSFGKSAYEFIDFLEGCGFTLWQVLPFNMVDEYNSPYKSYSSFSGNPYFVDLEVLYEKGLLTDEELVSARQQSPWLCEYERLAGERFELLKKASKRVENKRPINKFIKENPYIAAFCEFMALKAANGGEEWLLWKTKKADKDILFAWQFTQYEFFTQWAKVREYAASKNIKIIGDIPIYVSHDSSDVWSHPEYFMLGKDGRPTHVAGVPPDYFCEDGQLWGNPLYDWKKMKGDNYKWWCDRIRHMSLLFDYVRIDHFRGIEAYWSVPACAKTAKEGKWQKGPGMSLIKEIKKAAGDTLIIAEDLGDITPEVEKLVKMSGFPGMRVFQFGFLSDSESSHMPHNYPENCISYTGTHDNNTLLGYLWELDDAARERMLSYCGHEGDWQSGCKSILRTMLSSHSSTVIMPIQDILGFGADTRINTPGKADNNWAFRVTKEQIDSIDRGFWKNLNKTYYR
ncbi:MAG: 4-alpha-glucanotransferase [Ruminococcaceae bacterium]|nr:4-alpha-glucanotransferase [Oscillospiraceae bacterium]